MAAGVGAENQRPEVAEVYSVVAVGHGAPHAAVIGAAGMSQHKLGLTLLRLRGEWDATPKPHPPAREDVAALAATAPVLPDGEHKGKVAVATVRRGQPVTRYVLPMAWAQHARAQWYATALRELGMQLPSYPAAHAALAEWLGAGPDNAGTVAASTLLYWLHPRCPECMGRKRRVVEGTGRLSQAKCGECHGTGLAQLPYAGWGRRAMGYINDCTNAARKDLSAQLRGMRRRNAPASAPAPVAGPVRVQLQVGERWRARSGTLYEVLRVNSAGCYVCDIVDGVGVGARVLYWPDGRPVGVGHKELSQGDLVHRVCEAPAPAAT